MKRPLLVGMTSVNRSAAIPSTRVTPGHQFGICRGSEMTAQIACGEARIQRLAVVLAIASAVSVVLNQ